jgi:hypothetical protein
VISELPIVLLAIQTAGIQVSVTIMGDLRIRISLGKFHAVDEDGPPTGTRKPGERLISQRKTPYICIFPGFYFFFSVR